MVEVEGTATTSFSLVAQWMTTRKWIDACLVWIVVDVVYVGMYQELKPASRVGELGP
jgi:nicotinamide riboside transporter PnuC